MYVHELRSNVRSLLIWSALVLLLVVMALAKFEGYHNNPELIKMVESMPKALLDAFNMRAFNLTTLEGFYGVMAMYYYLMAAVASAMWAANVIAKEEFNRTAEFTLVLPLPRHTILTAKALAALVNSIAFVAVTWIASIVAVQSYQPDSAFYGFLAREMMAMFAIELIFLAIGLLAACAMRRPKYTGGIVIAVILTTYYLSFITGLHEKLDFLKYLSPFKYFDAAELLHQGNVAPVYWALTAAIILLSLAGAYYTYNRRDLYI
jgi:ABC-2 type transport system permease protein